MRTPACVHTVFRVLPCVGHCARPWLYSNPFSLHGNPSGVGAVIYAVQIRTETQSG